MTSKVAKVPYYLNGFINDIINVEKTIIENTLSPLQKRNCQKSQTLEHLRTKNNHRHHAHHGTHQHQMEVKVVCRQHHQNQLTTIFHNRWTWSLELEWRTMEYNSVALHVLVVQMILVCYYDLCPHFLAENKNKFVDGSCSFFLFRGCKNK